MKNVPILRKSTACK